MTIGLRRAHRLLRRPKSEQDKEPKSEQDKGSKSEQGKKTAAKDDKTKAGAVAKDDKTKADPPAKSDKTKADAVAKDDKTGADADDEEAPPEIADKYDALAAGLEKLRKKQTALFARYTPQSKRVRTNKAEIDRTNKEMRDLEKQYPSLADKAAPAGSPQERRIGSGHRGGASGWTKGKKGGPGCALERNSAKDAGPGAGRTADQRSGTATRVRRN